MTTVHKSFISNKPANQPTIPWCGEYSNGTAEVTTDDASKVTCSRCLRLMEADVLYLLAKDAIAAQDTKQ